MATKLSDKFFLGVITVLLVVITIYAGTILRTLENSQEFHRYRNEAQNFCQLKVLHDYDNRPSLDEWLKKYLQCTIEVSGHPAPSGERFFGLK